MPIKWIGDISSNHNKDINRAESIMIAAKQAGCWGVKFQLFQADLLYRQDSISRIQRQAITRRELPRGWVSELCQKAHEIGLKIGFTPFDLPAVDVMYHHRYLIDFVKIGSYELLWIDLIEVVAKLPMPIILSTGMSTLDEINRTKWCIENATEEGNTRLELLHCNSNYPAKAAECDMHTIQQLVTKFSCPVGWSDHSVKPGVIFAALAAGAKTIEFHLDLDGTGWEFSDGHCWLPLQIASVIEQSEDFISASEPDPNVIYSTESFDNLRRLRMERTDPTDGLRPLKETKNG